MPGAFDAIRYLQALDCACFVFTSRFDQLDEIAIWITDHSGIPCCVKPGYAEPFWNDTTMMLVTSRKLGAQAYIDDRAVRFLNWEQALTDLHLPNDEEREADAIAAAIHWGEAVQTRAHLGSSPGAPASSSFPGGEHQAARPVQGLAGRARPIAHYLTPAGKIACQPGRKDLTGAPLNTTVKADADCDACQASPEYQR